MPVLVQRCMDTSLFANSYKNDALGCPASDPQLVLQVVLLAYSRGMVSSRRIEPAGREKVTCMALACGTAPDHSTMAAFLSSRHDEIVALFRAMLLVCAAQEWRGTFADLRQKKESRPAPPSRKRPHAPPSRPRRRPRGRSRSSVESSKRRALRTSEQRRHRSGANGVKSCRAMARIMNRPKCRRPTGSFRAIMPRRWWRRRLQSSSMLPPLGRGKMRGLWRPCWMGRKPPSRPSVYRRGTVPARASVWKSLKT
jgi:hypothetical protein